MHGTHIVNKPQVSPDPKSAARCSWSKERAALSIQAHRHRRTLGASKNSWPTATPGYTPLTDHIVSMSRRNRASKQFPIEQVECAHPLAMPEKRPRLVGPRVRLTFRQGETRSRYLALGAAPRHCLARSPDRTKTVPNGGKNTGFAGYWSHLTFLESMAGRSMVSV
jgi:hypothetical protein